MESGDEFELSDYSETIEEVPEVPVLSAQEEIKPKPTYSAKELDELVTVLKRMVFLDGIKEDDWNDDCEEVIQTWFLDTNYPILIVFYSAKQRLTTSLTYPIEPVLEIVYFLREPDHIFSLDNFHDDVTFGKIDDDVTGTCLLLMEKLYTPIFFHKTDWSDTNRAQFLAAIHSFLSHMTSLHYKLSGLTYLYVPREGLIDDTEKAINDKELIKRLETIAEHWITQLRICFGDSEQMVPYKLLCPRDEYEFWIYRCEVLLAVKYQVNQKDFLKVFAVLRKSQSIFVQPIDHLIGLVEKEIDRAQNNVRYLKLLIEPCSEITTADSPADIPMKLPRIINIIRFIWLNSGYFNTADLITKLFRYVGNQVIHFCRKTINVSAVFSGDATNQIKVANMSIDCCLYYKVIYEKISKQPGNEDWVLRHCMIFNHIDSFINRLHDFIEICGGIIIFSRKLATENHPQLEFGGDRGTEFEGTCERIESTFEKGIVKIKTNSHCILNINEKTWLKIMREFREMTSNLEEIIDNLIMNVFTRVENVEDGIYALACLQKFSTRDKLHKSFERKVSTVWNLFADDLSIVNDQVIADGNEHLSYVPTIAGQTIQFKVNRMRLIRLRSLFEQNEWLPESIDTAMILTNYKTMITKMERNTQTYYDGWVQSLGVDIASKLNRLLVKRSLTHKGLFECNVDESIFTIFREARFFQMLGFGFPVHLNQFFSRERAIRQIYDSIVEMITSYNRILMSLSETERLLLMPLIQISDKCIAPGALRLIWANEGLDVYISDCNKNIRDLSDFIHIYRQTNAKIVSTCERLCQIVAVEIPKGKPRQLDEIEQLVQTYLDKQTNNIEFEVDAVRKLILIIRDEMEDVESIQDLWTDYVFKFDKLIEEALTISARESFRSIFCTLNGNGILGPDPLIHVVLDVQDGMITQSPCSTDVRAMLQSIYGKLSQSQQKIRRLLKTMKLTPTEPLPEYFEVISNDAECLRWQSKIREEIEQNECKLKEYEEHWMQFAHIWQSDKAVIINEFESLATVSAFAYDKHIQDFITLSNQVALRNVTKKVNFTLVDATKLRKTILVEIEEWKRLYLISLKTKTQKKIIEFFTYTNENGQKVSIAPKTVEELQKCCAIYEQLRSELDDSKCNLNSLSDQFDVLLKYGVPIDGEFDEMKQNMFTQWEDYLKKLNDADEVLNNAKDSFKLTLESTRKTPDFFQ
ncbi:dynein axonemal heavy chain 2 [Sitodiplosis mosellana]|uniref:dynein axonemal heavy chain 2 n=1 Tax=Sitodiplosis mosellana TaxID=263140 RepID=UPI002443EFE6|nr:dynein axonemal heavy chain 2 [Sitodiplosis mosellana]